VRRPNIGKIIDIDAELGQNILAFKSNQSCEVLNDIGKGKNLTWLGIEDCFV